MSTGRLVGVAFVAVAAAALALAAPPPPIACDVLVAGGSLASVAAAVAAANTSSSVSVCLLDITDWPGGQLTASAVPAVDFGPHNGVPANLPAPFVEFLFGSLMPGGINLGDCWVSKKCFNPLLAVNGFIFPLFARFPNLAVYLNTAVSSTQRDKTTGRILSVTAVRRTPVSGTTGWEAFTSAMLADWYDPNPSAAFTKEVLTFNVEPRFGVVVEATEFGDVLMTAGLPVGQGPETPTEDSRSYVSYCGQGTTVPFYVAYGPELAPSPDPWPAGNPEGLPYQQQGMSWQRDWTYRRIIAAGDASGSHASIGETSVINVGNGNDFDNGYLFYPLDSPQLRKQLAGGFSWRGGVNTSALSDAEQRSLGFYHWFKANASESISPYLTLNATLAGTANGVAKMPYLRDARRSAAGLGGFRLFEGNLSRPGADNRTAHQWPDTIGIGQYFFADIHTMTAASCPLPSYIIPGAPVLPYYLPWRALTVEGAPNVIAAGKNLAMSFWANAAVRLHPEEWVTGMAGGVAASLMVQNGWDTQDVLDNVVVLRQSLSKQGQPLTWTL